MLEMNSVSCIQRGPFTVRGMEVIVRVFPQLNKYDFVNVQGLVFTDKEVRDLRGYLIAEGFVDDAIPYAGGDEEQTCV